VAASVAVVVVGVAVDIGKLHEAANNTQECEPNSVAKRADVGRAIRAESAVVLK